MLANQRPKPIEYMSKNRDQKESVKDFIDNARNILMSQISINDKTEETERLKEYIIMEKEKLEEAKKTFDEDKDKFQKYIDDLERKAQETAQQVKDQTVKKNKCMQDITELQTEIYKKSSRIKKINEELLVYKQYKVFLDGLAEFAGKKTVTRTEQPSQQKPGSSAQQARSRGSGGAKDSNTFQLTQVKTGAKEEHPA